jgi:hypothetical protein
MDPGTITSAWAVAGILSRVYALICSAAAILVVMVIVGPADAPSDLLIQALDWLAVPNGAIEDVSTWIHSRAEAVTGASMGLTMVALGWSALVSAPSPSRAMDARGPWTAWLLALVTVEASGTSGVVDTLVVVGTLGLGAVAVEWLSHRSPSTRYSEWAVAPTLGLILLALVLTPLIVPIAIAHALGGESKSKN